MRGSPEPTTQQGRDTRFLPNQFSPDGRGDKEAEREKADLDPDLLIAVWPLHMVDFKDHEQSTFLFRLLRRVPQVIEWYLYNHVLPLTMRFQPQKLSASGQEIGGGLVFGRRLGFSGTPSNLLPVELGECCFEKGDDGKILTTLTSPGVTTIDVLPTGHFHHLSTLPLRRHARARTHIHTCTNVRTRTISMLPAYVFLPLTSLPAPSLSPSPA